MKEGKRLKEGGRIKKEKIMKTYIYIFTGILLLLIKICPILYQIEKKVFNPLQSQELRKIFLSYEKIKKRCSIDNIKLSSHGELFEIYLFNTQKAILDINYPNYANEWEKEKITSETIISKWKKCPLDTTAYKLFKFAFTTNNYNQSECLKSFSTELSEPNNFYSYVYFNDLEYYFLLYCTHKEELYYIRVKL